MTRSSSLYEINSPEFFDNSLFQNFLGLLRERQVLSVSGEDRIEFDVGMLEAIVSDAQVVLNEQVRNSILQVVHR